MYQETIWVIKMKNILSIMALAFLASMITASADEITVTSPVPGQKYYIWDEVPIEFTSTLAEGYNYTTYVNNVETTVFAPEKGGKYVVKVLAENPGCEDCYDKQRQITINIGYFPPVDKTRIVITSPEIGVTYSVNESVPIEFATPLINIAGFKFKAYVTGPDGVRNKADTWTWTPSMPGEYSIDVNAVGNGFIFGTSRVYEAE